MEENKPKIIDNSIIKRILNPNFNLASLKARLRLNEFKKKLSELEYNNYFRKCKNIYSISSSMNNKMSISDLYHHEKNNSNKIINTFKQIDNDFNLLQKSKSKYKIKPLNTIKDVDNRNHLIESIHEDISKYLKILQSSNNIEKQKSFKENLINNLSNIHQSPQIKKCKSINNLTPLNISSTNSTKNIIDRKRFKIKINNLKYNINNFNLKNENKEEIKNNSFINYKKFPFISQNTNIIISKPEGVINKYYNKNKNNNSKNYDSYLFNFPSIKN